MDWIHHGDHMYDDLDEPLSTVDTALYGRVTYQMMESYWPTIPSNPESTENEIEHANWVEQIEKIVFSQSLPGVEWNNTRLIKENITEEINALKQQPGKNLMIFGSPRLSHSFMELGLIDEYRLYVNPAILGEGIPLFKNVPSKVDLQLLNTKIFDSGVIRLHYSRVETAQ